MPRRSTTRAKRDEKILKPRFLKARLSEDDHAALLTLARTRGIKVSKLTRVILTSHLKGVPASLPHPRGLTDALIHQFARIGNNLNQLARQANAGYVAVSAKEIHSVIETLNAKVASL